MSYTNGLDDPTAYFQTVIWTGNGSARSITLDGNSDLQPDMVWLKQRSGTENHNLYDSVRGAGVRLIPNLANSESTTNELTAFNSDGFSLADGDEVNANSSTYVAWNWKGGTTGSGTTNGSKAYSYSASPDAGFSVVTYTGNATAGHLIPHGMGKVPRLIHVKSRADDNGWTSGTIGSASAWNDHGYLYLAKAFGTDANQFGATPDTTNFRLGTGTGTNGNNATRVAYCFADVQGYQKIGKFSGNANADGTFVYCGFKPRWIMIKGLNVARNWGMNDTKRSPINQTQDSLYANVSDAETGSGNYIDFLSNGFKLRDSALTMNGSYNYLFHAIAENPFVTSTGVPACAR